MTAPGDASSSPQPRSNRLAAARRRAPWTLPVIIIIVIAVVAVIDHLGSKRIAQVEHSAPPALVPVNGGSATVALPEPWSGYNPGTPQGAASSSAALLAQVYPSAYVLSPQLVPEVNTDLLVSVEVTSTAPLTIIYTINPKAVWSDGVPVTAQDFVYAWLAQRGDGTDVNGTPDLVASTNGYRDISTVTGSKNGRVVTVVFATPFTDWRTLFNHMVPAHVADTAGWNSGFAVFNPSVVLSAGPYEIQRVDGSGTAHLVRNPRWWGTPPPLASLNVHAGPVGAAGLASGSTGAGQADAFGLSDVQQVSSPSDLQSTLKASLALVSLEFNVQSPVFLQTAVRQAIAHIIDRTAVLGSAVGALEPTAVLPDDHLAVSWQANYQASSAAGEYDVADPTTAERLLRAAGYTRDASGHYVDAAGKPLLVRLAVESGTSWTAVAGFVVAEQLQAAGVQVTVSTVAGPTVGRGTGDPYDAVIVNRASSPYPSATQGWFTPPSVKSGVDEAQNWSHLDDPQVEQLFDQGATVLNPVTGRSVYAQIDDQLWDQMVSLPLFNPPGLESNGVHLSGVTYNPTVDGLLWNVQTWSTLTAPPAGSNGSS